MIYFYLSGNRIYKKKAEMMNERCPAIVTENIEATKTQCGHRLLISTDNQDLKSSNNHHLHISACVGGWGCVCVWVGGGGNQTKQRNW